MKTEMLNNFRNNLEKEMDEFRNSYKKFDTVQTYNDWYIIGFYEEYYEMLMCDFIDNKISDELLAMLSEKQSPLAFMYDEWLSDSTCAFSHSWEDMLDWLEGTVIYSKYF